MNSKDDRLAYIIALARHQASNHASGVDADELLAESLHELLELKRKLKRCK